MCFGSFFESRQKCLDERHWSDKVDRHDLVDVGPFELVNVDERLNDPRVVDETVDGSKRLFNLRRQGGDLGAVGHIDSVGGNRSPEGLRELDRFVERFGPQIHRRNLRPAPDEFECEFPPHSTSGAGDDDDFSADLHGALLW